MCVRAFIPCMHFEIVEHLNNRKWFEESKSKLKWKSWPLIEDDLIGIGVFVFSFHFNLKWAKRSALSWLCVYHTIVYKCRKYWDPLCLTMILIAAAKSSKLMYWSYYDESQSILLSSVIHIHMVYIQNH